MTEQVGKKLCVLHLSLLYLVKKKKSLFFCQVYNSVFNFPLKIISIWKLQLKKTNPKNVGLFFLQYGGDFFVVFRCWYCMEWSSTDLLCSNNKN